MKYFDIHSHLNFSQFADDREEVIETMRERDIATICVGTDKETSKESIELATRYEHIWATVGLHPTDWQEGFEAEEFESLFTDRVVGLGETGLDYYRGDEGKEEQKQIFEKHIKLALTRNLPLMLHGRPSVDSMDAYEDMLSILESYSKEAGEKLRGHAHFFVGSLDIAKRFLDLGFTLGFDGPITFSREYDDVVRFVPLSMLCAETDAPFAAPDPHRGKRNSPLFIEYIVQALAKIRDEDVEEVRKATVENAKRVFGV